jgi:hypothetical protein
MGPNAYYYTEGVAFRSPVACYFYPIIPSATQREERCLPLTGGSLVLPVTPSLHLTDAIDRIWVDIPTRENLARAHLISIVYASFPRRRHNANL